MIGRRIANLKTFCILTILVTAMPLLLMAAEPPRLIIEAPESLQPIATRLTKLDARIFLRTMAFLGLTHPGPPIRVILAEEESPMARQVPGWAAGFALSHRSTIVVFPRRVLNYPYDSLEGVLVHEMAHILTYRAAAGHPLPRWFDEGLAMIAARSWEYEDQARLVWALVTHKRVSLDELNQLFLQDHPTARRAYLLAHAVTLDILDHAPPEFPKQLLGLVRQGLSFDEAFSRAALFTLQHAETNFWNRQTRWNRWIPVVTGTGMLWLGITLLVFLAFVRQRRRATRIQKEWEENGED